MHINPNLIDLGVSVADLVLHKIFYILLFLVVKVALQKHVKPVSYDNDSQSIIAQHFRFDSCHHSR
jgi:hypothetical protein